MFRYQAALIATLIVGCSPKVPPVTAMEEPDDPDACPTACANRERICGVEEPTCETTCYRIELAPGVRNWARCAKRATTREALAACKAECP